ncbi:MAG TPA: magnesium-translocating P-type ATPase [Gallionellaceae bacterium]|nr:magnesium-translocating P-type ATPase [Gallionellaceae bacterium]
MEAAQEHPNVSKLKSDLAGGNGTHNFTQLLVLARFDNAAILSELRSRADGLTQAEVKTRLKQFGLNAFASEKQQSSLMRLLSNAKNPLVLLLMALGVLSFLTGDLRATVVIFVMVVLGIVLRFVQEMRADKAAEKLKAMVSNTATVVRAGKESEISLQKLVPGDIIHLAAGDMVPADVRLIYTKDLFLNQSALTGESMPVERKAGAISADIKNPLELPNTCFHGSNVVSGAATAVVILTGNRTYFGSLVASITIQRQLTSFDLGINKFTWMMILFIAVMVPTVFLLNGISKHNWTEAFLFAMAVAVGLTPEMLPMIVTVNLSKGALVMARKKMIVKRLNSIQNFGAMDVLCADKTGTLTQGKIVLEKHLNVHGDNSVKVLHYGFLNSYHHTGLKNLLDEAILAHEELEAHLKVDDRYRKVDEIPYDFVRRRMSVIVEDETGLNTLICKGAVEEMLALCSRVEVEGQVIVMLPEHIEKSTQMVAVLNSQGFRVIVLAYKEMPDAPDVPVYEAKDEADLVLLGFLAFLDPPKETAAKALKRLLGLNVKVKILTGDSEIITAYICQQVGMPVEHLLLGSQIEAMSDGELADAVEAASVFAKLLPAHKERIIHALQSRGHVVGFVGDGINDAPALKAADVGISVDGAVDIAKESSDIILLESSLLILEQGVLEGRRVFGNIIKYIKMAASSNFGNMFSVVGASVFLPFLPMLPIQVLINNLLYDFSQTTIPTDEVDADWLTKPRKWGIEGIERFILIVGPISSIFDYLTFFIMLHVFDSWQNPELFHTGWFVESIFTQTLIIHIIRTNRIPFIQSRASWPLIATSLIIVLIAAWLTVSPLAATLGLVQLPSMYWLLLGGMLLGYMGLTQMIKIWFNKKFGE